jgi:hypothetical protein
MMTKRTEILHEITLWGAILSIIAILFSAFFFMDSRHASDKKVTKVEIELRQRTAAGYTGYGHQQECQDQAPLPAEGDGDRVESVGRKQGPVY